MLLHRICRTVRADLDGAHPYAAVLLGMAPALAGAACDWSRPGAAPYRAAGDVTAATAVESYTDIPPAARADLVARIRGQREDALLLISRDGLQSPQGTATGLRDMHWRDGLCRGAVSRAGWASGHVEKALVYCSGVDCLVVPSVCGNVSRVTFEWHVPASKPAAGVPEPVHGVPEPSSLLLVLLALAAARKATS